MPTSFQQSILTLNLYLTNPARSNEKFGDLMFVVIEIVPQQSEADVNEIESPGSRLEKSEIIDDEDEE